MNHQFEGIWVPIVTPFQQGEVDLDALVALACSLASQGIHGLVVGATTGEGASLTIDERIQIIVRLRNALPTGFPLVIGLNGMDTAATALHAAALAQAEPDGLLVTPPPYVRPGQDGIRRHFEVIAQAADLPIIIYDIPYRTGVDIEVQTLQALSRDPRIVALKSCGASVDRLMQLIHETSLKILIGEDSQFFAALTLGAHGAIAASAHYRPEIWVRIFELIVHQELNAARALAIKLQSMIRALFSEPNPAPIKAWLASEGRLLNELRLPFLPAHSDTLSRIQTVASNMESPQLW